MDIKILGPLEVDRGGRRISLGPKQQMLLAILLIDRGGPVSIDRIVDHLYPDPPPTSAAKSIQVHVSRLRKALGDGSRLQTVAGGYRFVAEPGELDLDRFEALAETGRRALEGGDAVTAAEELAKALSLWRGPALVDFAYADFAQTEIARLEERRLETLEDRIDADLALGRHSSIVGELRTLAAIHPLRERLTAQLMLALYRSGRQADALETFASARDSLVETLGIDPGRALRELERAILQQDPSLDFGGRPEVPPALVLRDDPGAPSGREDGHESRKTVTALSAAISGSPGGGVVLDPEALRRVTSVVFTQVTNAVNAHGGSIESVSAEAMSAVFGVPEVHEDDALRAIRAAVDIHERLRDVAREHLDDRGIALEVQVGVSTGEVVAGVPSQAALLVTGAPFIKAERLAEAADPGATLLDEATLRLVGKFVEGEREIIGQRSVFRLARLVGSAVLEPRFNAPMIGRERELRRLSDAYEQAIADRSCQLFTILGTAGVGKSRLVQEFLDGLSGAALVAQGRCLPYGEGITFWPVLEAVKQLVDVDDTAPETTAVRIAALIPDTDDAHATAERVSELIGLSEPRVSADERVSAMRRFVEDLGRHRPLVLVFDDIHWGEATFLDLVEYLADWCRGSAILLLCMARPELLDARPHWGGGKLNATSVLLEPLSDEECAHLVGNLMGETALSDELNVLIADAAEGNPLFVEELLSMLIDDELLVKRGAEWIAAADLTSLPVPPTINALLAARLDRLGADERDVIERAAVEGKVFHLGSLAALGDEDGAAGITSALGGLLRKELVRPDTSPFSGEQAYRFRHLLIRDAAYDSIPKQVRAELHQRHARWLEQRVSGRSAEYDEIVGYHLEQAFRYRTELEPVDKDGRELGRRAARLLGRAGRRAFSRSDGPAGAKLISRAVALLAPEDPLRVELVPSVRGIQGLADVGWADQVLTEAVEASATTGDRRLAAHALVQRALLRLFTGMEVSCQQLLDTSTRAISVFEETNDDLGLARAWRLAAQAHYLDGRAARCTEASERALVHARRAKDPFEEREIVEWLLVALIVGPAPAAEAAARCERLLDETVESGALHSQIYAALAALAAMDGDEVAAHNFIAQSRAIMEDLGEWSGIVSFSSGFIGAATGNLWERDTIAADAQLVPAYEALKAIGEKSHFSSITHVRAAIAYAGGRYEEAERFTRECEEACRANDVYSGIVWRSIRAKVLARRGAFDDAERLAYEAVSRAEQSDFLIGHAEALADLGEVRELAGDIEGAVRVLEQAVVLYERKGNTLAAAECRARLARLAG